MALVDSGLNNYSKGEVIDEDDDPGKYFEDLPSTTVFVRVKAGSKIRNILGFAIQMFKKEENKHMVFTGRGDAIYKAITCAEIIKRKHKKLHQITRVNFHKVEEFWEPKDPELDRIKVAREIPQIHIMLCKDPLNSTDPGYQVTGNLSSMWTTDSAKKRKWKHK